MKTEYKPAGTRGPGLCTDHAGTCIWACPRPCDAPPTLEDRRRDALGWMRTHKIKPADRRLSWSNAHE